MVVSIEPADFPRDLETIHSLFSAYAISLGIDLAFQSFQEELESLPGKYHDSQGGTLLLARAHREIPRLGSSTMTELPSISTSSDTGLPTPHTPVLGCVGLRRSTDSNSWCEMKRLYVIPEARGLYIGDQLVVAIMDKAKALGYSGIRLDTLPDMIAAQRLYRRYGFAEIDPYYHTPIKATIFMGFEFTRNI
ncbi:hypothetical protein N7454_006828 [Penicillium verhagenii]|nr:hypothetical protein N7454_006828 [Penicillium verhagenii]